MNIYNKFIFLINTTDKDNIKIFLNSFMTEDVYHIETSPLICRENQWTGFFMIGSPIMNEIHRLSFYNFILRE